MDSNGVSLRKLATTLGVSQPFLSQIRGGKRPMPKALKLKAEALGAYHLLIADKQNAAILGELETRIAAKSILSNDDFETDRYLAGLRGSRTHLPRSSRGITDLKLPQEPS